MTRLAGRLKFISIESRAAVHIVKNVASKCSSPNLLLREWRQMIRRRKTRPGHRRGRPGDDAGCRKQHPALEWLGAEAEWAMNASGVVQGIGALTPLSVCLTDYTPEERNPIKGRRWWPNRWCNRLDIRHSWRHLSINPHRCSHQLVPCWQVQWKHVNSCRFSPICVLCFSARDGGATVQRCHFAPFTNPTQSALFLFFLYFWKYFCFRLIWTGKENIKEIKKKADGCRGNCSCCCRWRSAPPNPFNIWIDRPLENQMFAPASPSEWQQTAKWPRDIF